ncbi:hypothetical protein V1T76_24535 [Roseibium sp. FZY0029]|uniref:hypothetical protein n=1 Tax=Roseibium sp. FZY0029 TaxID=3116647 RepID=UPI002EB26983|nr:hypothetical protein [Roseibium sp. FZY0029]
MSIDASDKPFVSLSIHFSPLAMVMIGNPSLAARCSGDNHRSRVKCPVAGFVPRMLAMPSGTLANTVPTVIPGIQGCAPLLGFICGQCKPGTVLGLAGRTCSCFTWLTNKFLSLTVINSGRN